MIAEHDLADLVGIPFEIGGESIDGIDCWGIVKVAYERLGRAAPEPGAWIIGGSSHHWQRIRPGQESPYDVAVYSMPGQRVHVGLLLPCGRILHALEGRTSAALARSAFACKLIGFWRPRAIEPVGDRQSGHVVIERRESPFSHSSRREVHQHTGGTLADYGAVDGGLCAVNGVEVSLDYRPQQGDVVSLTTRPHAAAIAAQLATNLILQAVIATAINLAIGIGLGLLYQAFAPKPKRDRETEVDQSPTFNTAGISNTIEPGRTIPVVFGAHRVGGQIIGIYQEVGDLTSLPPPPPGSLPFNPFNPTGQQPPIATPPTTVFGETISTSDSVTGGKSTLNMLIAISEGPVQSINGLTADADEVAGTALDRGTLYLDGNDARDYNGLAISVRMGTATQRTIAAFARTVNAVAQDRILRQNEVWGYETSQAVTGWEIQLFEPQGHYRISASSGEPKSVTINYQLRWRHKGATAWTEDIVIERKYMNRGAHSWRIRRLELAPAVYEVQLVRLTINPDDPANDRQQFSESQINAVNEYTPGGANYAGIALMAVRAIASEQISGVPTLTSFVEGKKLWRWDETTPSNAPAFVREWSANPADALFSYVLNRTWGTGAHRDLDDIDLESLAEWRGYCNEPISDGRGGMMDRCRFDAVYDTATQAGEWIDRMLTAGNARLVPVGAKIGVAIARARDASSLLSEAVVSDLVIGYASTDQRPNRVTVQFLNEELDYDYDAVTYPPDADDEGGFIEEVVQAVGITKPARALRLAKRMFNVGRSIRRTMEGRASALAALMTVGDVFWLATPTIRRTEFSGRLAADSSTATQIRLDRAVTLAPATSYAARVLVPDGGALEPVVVTITATAGDYAAGAVIACADPGVSLLRGQSYAFGIASESLSAFECQSVTMDGALGRNIKAIEYDATVYSDDPGVVPVATDDLPDRRLFPAAVTGLRIAEDAMMRSDGGLAHRLVASWSQRSDGAAEVFVATIFDRSRTGDNEAGIIGWVRAGRSTTGSLSIGEFSQGQDVAVSVVPVADAGHHKRPDRGTIALHTVCGKSHPPLAPTALALDERHEDIVAHYVEPTDRDLDHVEVRVGRYWAGGWKVAAPARMACPAVFPSPVPPTDDIAMQLHARAVNTSRITSHSYATVPLVRDGGMLGDTPGAVVESESVGDWSGTISGATLSSGDLVSDVGAAIILYTSPIIDMGGEAYGLLTAYPDITIHDRDPEWDDDTFPWPWDSAAARARIWDDEDATIIDLPDTREDVISQAWDDAEGMTWDGEFALRRTIDDASLDSSSLMRVTIYSRWGDSSGAVSAADWTEHSVRAIRATHYQIRVEVKIPNGDAYLVRIHDLLHAIVARRVSTASLPIVVPWVYYIPFDSQSMADTGGGTILRVSPSVADPTTNDALVVAVWEAANVERAHFSFVPDAGLDLARPLFCRIFFSLSGAVSAGHSVRFKIHGRSIGLNESHTTGGWTTGEIVHDANIEAYSSGRCVYSSLIEIFPGNRITHPGLINGTIGRDGPADTYTGTVRYIGIQFIGDRKEA